jgi:fibronectin-binding autotransporter adhesin
MKNPIQTARFAAILVIAAFMTSPAFAATTIFLDQNGTSPGFWDQATTNINSDVTTTTNWTTDPTGVAVTTIGAIGDNYVFGNADSDFNGANITFNTLAATLSGTNFAVVGTNTTVTWASTGNAHFNTSGTTVSVAKGSTIIWTSTANNGGFNFNKKRINLKGSGRMIFQSAFLANDGGAASVMDMAGGTIQLVQSRISNYGATGTSFAITNGTLQFGSATALADTFQAFVAGTIFNLNGGTIDNTSGSADVINLGAGSYNIGGNFTFAGSSDLALGPANPVTLLVTPAITVNAGTFTIGGAVTDNGAGLGFTKAGNGTLLLTNANNYTGPITINGGTFIENSTSTGNNAYTVNDGGTLGVMTASVGQPLNASSLTLGTTTGAQLQFDLGLLGNPTTTAALHVGGALTVNGTSNPISIVSISAITNYPVVIPLISYGSASGNLSSLTLGSLPQVNPPFKGYISNDTANLVIDLVLTNGVITQPPGNPKAVTWLGNPNGNWDATTTNWISSGVATNYSNLTLAGAGDSVTFDDTLTGTTNVVLTTKLVPSSITFNNNNSNYVFTGSGRISASAVVSLNGTGALILDNRGDNDFNGGLNINSGLVQIGNNDTNGNPGDGLITDNGALVFNRTDTNFLMSDVISGIGSVTNNGTGVVNLSGVETFTGPTVVNAGTLALSGPNSAASGLSASSVLIINSPGVVRVDSDNALAGNSYALPVTINAGGVLTGNPFSNAGSGISAHVHGTVTLNGGTLAMGGTSINLANGSWDLQGAPDVIDTAGGNVTSTMSALDMIPEAGGGSIFNIPAGATPSGIDLLVSGSLINGTSQHDSGIIKNGTGVMVLDNNNTYAAGTTVNGGILQLGLSTDAAALAMPLGVGPVNLATSGILKFNSGKGVVVSNAIADDNTGLVLVNSGSNVLAGANTYTGPTMIAAGASLALRNSATLNSSSINLSSATLDASSGSVITASGSLGLDSSTLVMGTNLIAGIGSLGATNSTLTMAVHQSAININVSGAVSFAGPTNIINLSAVPGFPVYPTNLVLIKYGTFSGDMSTVGLQLPSLGSPAGHLINDTANSSIDLVLQSDTLVPIFPITWNGQAGGLIATNWDLVTSNWVLSANPATGYPYQDTSVVTFDDTAVGSTAVNITTAVAPSILSVSNASKAYTFTGPGSIVGAVGLSKTDTGTATFAETGGDSFIGGVSMNGGTLILSNANANISGGLTVNSGALIVQHSGTIAGGLTVNGGSALLDQSGVITGNTANNAGTVQVGNNDAKGALPTGTLDNEGGLIFNRSDAALNVTTVIAGGGGLTNNGTGSVKLSANETMTGPIVVNAGTLVMNAGNNTSPAGISRASSLTINNGATVTVLVDNSILGHGATAGTTAPITINAGGTLTGDASLPNGTSSHLPSALTLNGGTLANSGTSLQTGNGSWDLEDGVATAGGPVTSTISAFDVVPNESGGTHFTVLAPLAAAPPSGIDLNVTGSLINGTSIHDSGVILDGNGTVAFSGTNTYILGTTLNAGVLIANAPELPGVSGPLGNTGAITFGGGTLRYSAVNSFDYSARFAAGGLYNIDTAGQSVTFAAALTSGSVTKLGSGTLALTGANTYTGDTVVSGGKLITTTASVGPGNYTATNGSTLDVQVAAPGTQLTMGSLTLGAGASDTSTLQIDTAATGNPTVAPVNVTGATTTRGTVNVALSGSALAPASFPLIAYAGASPFASLHFVPPAGFTGSLSDNNAGLISVAIVSSGPTTNASITKVSLVGTNLVVHGTNNNVPNTGRYVVLTATNIATALSNWTPVATNGFSNGTFDYTNPIVPGTVEQFIDIKVVP